MHIQPRPSVIIWGQEETSVELHTLVWKAAEGFPTQPIPLGSELSLQQWLFSLTRVLVISVLWIYGTVETCLGIFPTE